VYRVVFSKFKVHNFSILVFSIIKMNLRIKLKLKDVIQLFQEGFLVLFLTTLCSRRIGNAKAKHIYLFPHDIPEASGVRQRGDHGAALAFFEKTFSMSFLENH
jgi:hypothetical protein